MGGRPRLVTATALLGGLGVACVLMPATSRAAHPRLCLLSCPATTTTAAAPPPATQTVPQVTTPGSLPPIAIHVTPSTTQVTTAFGRPRTVTLRTVLSVTGDAFISLQFSRPPYRRWINFPVGHPQVGRGAGARRFSVSFQPDENAHFRLFAPVSDGGNPNGPFRPASASNVVAVTVFPYTSLALTEKGNRVTATEQAFIAPVPLHWRGEDVSFYSSDTGHNPFRLIGRAAFRRVSTFGEVLPNTAPLDVAQAAITFTAHHSGTVITCLRHQIVADMGTPFLLRACGAPRVDFPGRG